MNFEDAVRLKNQKKSPYYYSDVKMKVYVVPDNQDDFIRYCISFKVNIITDETAKIYSSNNEYTVRGMWSDGVIVRYDTNP